MRRRKVRKLLAELPLLAEPPQRGMQRAPADFSRDVLQSFEGDGWRVFDLPDGINDEASFVRAATAFLPLSPPWYGHSWDAFDGSLFEGLLELPERRFAILWPDATTLAYSDPKTFGMVLDCLEAVTDDLADAEATEGNPKDLAVVLAREGIARRGRRGPCGSWRGLCAKPP